MNKTRIVHTYK